MFMTEKLVIQNKILDRLMQAARASGPSDLAKLLDVSPQAVYDAKRRDKVPDAWVRLVAEQSGVSADWLFFGEREAEKATPIASKAKAADGSSALYERLFQADERLFQASERERALMMANADLRVEVGRMETRLTALQAEMEKLTAPPQAGGLEPTPVGVPASAHIAHSTNLATK
jgi:hypothetical protein